MIALSTLLIVGSRTRCACNNVGYIRPITARMFHYYVQPTSFVTPAVVEVLLVVSVIQYLDESTFRWAPAIMLSAPTE
jgi:hypothetical protein